MITVSYIEDLVKLCAQAHPALLEANRNELNDAVMMVVVVFFSQATRSSTMVRIAIVPLSSSGFALASH